jgi:hypothetical protein
VKAAVVQMQEPENDLLTLACIVARVGSDVAMVTVTRREIE